MSANHPKKAPKSRRICARWPPAAPNQKQTISWATWLKTRFPVHQIHLQPPTFGGLHPPQNCQTDTYPYLGPVGYGKPQEVAKQVGAKLAEHGPPGAKKDLFSKMILDHMECQNRFFWRVLSPLWPVFPLLQSQNALEMGCFGTINGSKMGQKWVGHEWVKNACFPKTDPRPFGVCK